MKAERLIFAVDIGTSSIKGCVAAVGDAGLRVVSFARSSFSAEELAPGAFRASAWERAFAALVSALPRVRGCEAIALSGNGPTLTPILADGSAAPPSMWHDGRALVPSGAGGRSLFLPKATSVFASRSPEAPAITAFLSCPEYLAAILTGERTTWLPTPAYRPVYWTPEDCRAYGLDPALFPPFIPTGSEAGRVTADAAERFGLDAGTPVIAGGPDFLMALLGTGAIEPGLASDPAGTSEGLNVCVGENYSFGNSGVHDSSDVTLRLLPHIIEPFRNASAIIPPTGKIFDSYRQDSARGGESVEAFVSRLAAQCPRGDVFFYPESSFYTPNGMAEPDSRGRALLDAIGFMVREGLESLGVEGLHPEALRLSGGQARNAAWSALKADLTGIRLLVPEVADGELVGDVCAALVGLGEASSLAEAARRVVRIARVYEPDPANRSRFDDAYGRWKQVRRENFL